MADWYDHIDDERRAFIERQHMFFVATAPSDPDDGFPNLSPKGRNLLRVLGPNLVGYVDYPGTAASSTRPACGVPRTSRAWSAESTTHARASSGAGSFTACRRCVKRRGAGRWTWRASASTAPPASGRSPPSSHGSSRRWERCRRSPGSPWPGRPRRCIQTATCRWPALGALSTAEWTGVPLIDVLDRAGLKTAAREVVFRGADGGDPSGDDAVPARFERSLTIDQVRDPDILLAYAMNGEPLPVRAQQYPIWKD